MLKHRNKQPRSPDRVVVVGSRSFVGRACLRRLESKGVPVLRLSRAEVDLAADEAAENLAAIFQPRDTLLFVAAVAPCRNPQMLIQNMRIVTSVHRALHRSPVGHPVNIGSDAIYLPQILKQLHCLHRKGA